MEDLVPRDGLSKFDYAHKTFRCCKCGQPIALSDESEALLVQDQVDEWHRFNELLSPDDEERLRRQVRERERGEQFSLTQYIHCRCLDSLDTRGVKQLREQGRFRLPTRATHHFTDLLYDLGGFGTHHCAYCQIVVNGSAPGFAYSALLQKSPVLYLHYACYARLSKQQMTAEKSIEEQYNTVPALPQGDLDPVMVTRQNVAWLDAMGRRRLSTREIEAYREWRALREQQMARWDDSQKQAWNELPPDMLEYYEEGAVDLDRESTEQVYNQVLIQASYPVQGELLRETRIQLNVLIARGTEPIDVARKRKLGED